MRGSASRRLSREASRCDGMLNWIGRRVSGPVGPGISSGQAATTQPIRRLPSREPFAPLCTLLRSLSLSLAGRMKYEISRSRERVPGVRVSECVCVCVWPNHGVAKGWPRTGTMGGNPLLRVSQTCECKVNTFFSKDNKAHWHTTG